MEILPWKVETLHCARIRIDADAKSFFFLVRKFGKKVEKLQFQTSCMFEGGGRFEVLLFCLSALKFCFFAKIKFFEADTLIIFCNCICVVFGDDLN